MPVKFDDPISSGRVTFDAPDSGGRVVFDEPSIYSQEGLAKLRRDYIQSVANAKRVKEERDAEEARTKYTADVRLIGMDEPLVSVPIPASVAAFGSEAAKSVAPTGAGVAAASAVSPYATAAARATRLIPGAGKLAAPVIQYGVPLVAGGVASMLTRAAEDEYLPRILPEQVAASYEAGAQAAGESPTGAMIGQMAGGLPFFRPGLPVNTTGGARIAVPAISGAIGGGIEGSQQLAAGQFDPQQLALAAGGAAFLNRETRLGQRIAPNLVLPNAQTSAIPSELIPVGQAMREPLPIPAPTSIAPDELAMMSAARGDVAAESAGVRAEGQRYVGALDESVDAEKVRQLAERMMGKTPEQQITVIDQEIRLQKDYLTPAEQRGALDLKQELQRQIQAQKALEEAANAEQKAMQDQQRAVADQQKAIAEVQKPPEMPESAKILAEPVTTTPSIANVATEVATQTKNSPYALQEKLNQMTAVPEAPVAASAQAAIEPVAAGRPPTESDPVKIASDRKEYDALQAQMAKLGYDKAGTEEFNKVWQATEDIKNRHGGVPPEITAVESSTPAKLPETRGLGVQYHGAAKPFELAPGGSYGGSEMNVLGSGLYTTDALDVASSYQKKNRAKGDQSQPTVYQITEKAPVKFFDLNTPLSDEILSATGLQSDRLGIVEDALESIGENKTLGRLFSEMRGLSKEYNIPAYEIQEYFDDAALGLSKLGYGGWRDVGGLAAGKGKFKPHDVKVYWFPENQVDLVVKNPLEKPTNATPRTIPEPAAVAPDANANNQTVAAAQAEASQGALSEAEFLRQQAPESASQQGRSTAATKAASIRRGQRGSVPASVLAPLGGAAAGATTGYAATERREGETEEQFQARRLKATLFGASVGLGSGVLTAGSLSRGAKALRESKAKKPMGGAVALPEVESGQGIRQTAEKVIENRSYPEQLRQTLADDPAIIYDKISRNQYRDTVASASEAELQQMLTSGDPLLRISAQAEIGSRLSVTPGMEQEGARVIAEFSKNFTSPAQILGLAGLIRSPEAMVKAVEETLRLAIPKGKPLPQLTPSVRKKLFDLSSENIKAETRFAKAERAARKDFNPTTRDEFKSAESAVGKSKKALADYTKDIIPERYGQIVSKIIKGNLLAPLSFAKNMFGNAAWQTLLRGSESVATGFDAIYSGAAGKPRVMGLGNPLPSGEELKAFGEGIRIAGKEMLTGPSSESYIKAEVQRGFHPLRAMLQTVSGLPAAERAMERAGIASLPRTPSGQVRINDRAKKLIEATLGIAPEASFRFLNIGDKPVRYAVQQRILTEQANLRGLKGVEREKFMLLPDPETQKLMETESMGGILAQENKAALKVGKFMDEWLVDISETMGQGRPAWLEDANKVLGTLTIPYRQFPANFAITAANFALPPVGMARAWAQAAKGNQREALRNMGEATIGFMLLGAAGYLWDKGLISEPADPKDKKRRSSQYETMGAQRLNISGLERLQAGGDPTYKRGDHTVDWSSMGPAAASFYALTKMKSSDVNSASRTGEIPNERGDFEAFLNVMDVAGFAFDQSFLAGTSAALDAFKDWDNYGDRFLQNTFRAVTSVAAPNSLEAFNRTQYKFIPEQKGDTTTETLRNVWGYKTGQLDQSERQNYKRDFWGKPITRTPEGQNPIISQFIDVTKGERKAPDPFKQSLLELYRQTRSTDVYPPLVTRNVSNNGVTVELDAKDYDLLQDFTGQFRETLGRKVASDPRFSSSEVIPEAKIEYLNRVYSAGAKAGKAQLFALEGFTDKYPELFGITPKPGHKSRVVSRDNQARGRLRMERNQAP
jgi:hypothetical protein